jgi:tetratricopeptide (TPR) repeat protein
MNRGDGQAAQGQSTDSPHIEGPSTDLSATASPAVLYAAGLQHLQGGRHLEAQLCCRQALAIDAAHADSLQLMGLVSLHAGQFDHAIEWLSRAIRQSPKTEYLSTLGFTLKQAGRLEEALAIFDKAVQLKPDDAELWRQLGGALAALNRPDDALLAYQHVLKLSPAHFEAAYQSGTLLHQMERFEEALAAFDLCGQWQPDNLSALFSRARTLRALDRHEECLALYRRLHALAPEDPVICNNVGDALVRLQRFQDGLTWFEKALQLKPDSAEVLANKGMALYQLNRLDEALDAYAQAKVRDPDSAGNIWQFAHLLLQTGNFAAGWAEREARWKIAGYSPQYPKLVQPKWLGKEAIAGKTILICDDEGLGDTLQFARYVPVIAARGANVILVVQDALCPLLSALPGISACLPFSKGQFPPSDLHCPTMSLPLACGTTLETIPSASYLPPLPAARVQAWDDRLGPRNRLRVGLAWSGNPHHKNDGARSMPFKTLLPLLVLDATFVSLQKEIRLDDRALLDARTDIIDLTPELTDFAETAALIENLDLVITVDTSIAHLAGTLGRPTWLMLSYVGEWRWLTKREDSPWYPSMRLFRQDETRDYARVVERMRAELQAMIFSSDQ